MTGVSVHLGQKKVVERQAPTVLVVRESQKQITVEYYCIQGKRVSAFFEVQVYFFICKHHNSQVVHASQNLYLVVFCC